MGSDRPSAAPRIPLAGRSTAFGIATALVSLVCLGLAGCERPDPLAEIRAQQAAGDLQGSIEPLRELLAEDPDDPEVNYLYGQALTFAGQASFAEWSLRKAMKDPEWRVPAAMRLAQGALAGLNYPAAIEATNSILEVDPDNVDALLMRANAYTHSKMDQEQALADANRIFELAPDHLGAYEPRILALLALDRIDEAAAAIEELGKRIEEAHLGPEMRAWHCATTAIFADDSEEFELAGERWADCLERYPSEPNVVWGAIKFYDARGELDRSREILREALSERPSESVFRSALAARLRHAGENAEAEALLREATKGEDRPLQLAGWMDLTKHHQALGEYAAAAEAARRALELARELGAPHPQLVLEYADSLALAGEFDRALAVADEMTLPAYREMIRARVAQERGEPAEALEHFDAAFRLWPDNPWARHSAAVAAEAIGDFDRAVEEYRNALRIDVGVTDARTRIGRILLAEGKPREALQILRLKIAQAPLDLDGELVSLRAFGQIGAAAPIRRSLEAFRRGSPRDLGRAAVAAAEGVRDGAGAREAMGLLRATPGLDLGDPGQADALRALVQLSREAGALEEAAATVQAALDKHPEAGALHGIQALVLELGGAPDDQVRDAYERALERDPDDAYALAGLGRLARGRDPEQALSFFDRATAANPGLADPMRAAAEVLIALGRPRAAEKRLEALLLAHPYDADAAARLATLQLERGEAADRTLELARRAVRFGGGSEALELLSRAQEQLGELEGASEPATRAKALPAGN